jgi:hypothetical protein
MNDSQGTRLEELAARISEAIRSLGEALKMSLGEALKIVGENVSEELEGIKAFFEEYLEKTQAEQETKTGWYVPQKIALSNQVSNRKPRMAVARSSL